MITIFVKELRENLKWALLILGILGTLVYFQIRDKNPLMMFALAGTCTAFFAPLAGLMMGVAQTLFETRPDNWAFVVHRPLPRPAIFAAKCMAGLLLLYTSLAVPCFLAAEWAARPGNLPMPFHMRMTLPVIADILTAGCFYFTGMILTLRNARWQGSRLLPLGLALVCSAAVVYQIPEFWQALLLILAVQIVAALAAWGAFSSGGSDDVLPPPRFGLGVMTYAGALCMTLFLIGASNIFLSTSDWQEYKMDRDGNLLRLTWSRQEGNYQTSVVTDAAGRPLTQYQRMGIDDPSNADRFLRFRNALLLDERFIPWPESILDYRFRNPTPGIVRLRAVAPPDTQIPSLCLFDVQRRLINLYDPVTHGLQGTIGPDGFASGQAPQSAIFSGAPLNLRQQASMHTVAFPSVVYWMELDRRRVRPVFVAPENDPVLSAVELPSRTDPKIVIATRSRLHLLSPSGQTIFSTPLNVDWTKNSLRPAILPSNHHLVLLAASLRGAGQSHQQYLEFGTDGGIVRQTEVPLARDFGDAGKMWKTAIFGCIYPLAALPLFPSWILDLVFGTRAHQFVWLFRACIFASGILCAAIAFLLGRRYGFGVAKAGVWSIASFLLGPACIVVLLSLNEWPARETCTACGAWKLTRQRKCSTCDAESPAPELDGCEIFEATDTSQTAEWSHLTRLETPS